MANRSQGTGKRSQLKPKSVGRPPAETPKRAPLNTKTTQALRAQLEAAATETGRPLTQEVEARLIESFAGEELWGGSEIKPILRALAQAALGVMAQTKKSPADDIETNIAVNKAWREIIKSRLHLPVSADHTEAREIVNRLDQKKSELDVVSDKILNSLPVDIDAPELPPLPTLPTISQFMPIDELERSGLLASVLTISDEERLVNAYKRLAMAVQNSPNVDKSEIENCLSVIDKLDPDFDDAGIRAFVTLVDDYYENMDQAKKVLQKELLRTKQAADTGKKVAETIESKRKSSMQ